MQLFLLQKQKIDNPALGNKKAWKWFGYSIESPTLEEAITDDFLQIRVVGVLKTNVAYSLRSDKASRDSIEKYVGEQLTWYKINSPSLDHMDNLYYGFKFEEAEQYIRIMKDFIKGLASDLIARPAWNTNKERT